MNDLPEELVLNIMRFSTISTIANISAVCKKYNSLHRDNVIWEQKYTEICGLDTRPMTWRKYPWYLAAKILLTKKYNLIVYEGKYDSYHDSVFVEFCCNYGCFKLYDILTNKVGEILNKNIKDFLVKKTQVVQKVTKFARYGQEGLMVRTLSEVSNFNSTWWFELFDKKIDDKKAIKLVVIFDNNFIADDCCFQQI